MFVLLYGMLAIANASCLVGIKAYPVQVEVQVGRGLPGFDIVGLPERGVRESQVRVKAALGAHGFKLPPHRLVLNLAPGDLRKTGSGYDLSIAVAALTACEAISPRALKDTLLVGELSLSGALRPVRGMLAQLRSAQKLGLKRAIVPMGNRREAALLRDFPIYTAETLSDVVSFLNDQTTLEQASECEHVSTSELGLKSESKSKSEFVYVPDFSEVRGQHTARRAMEIAASGGHHLILIGAPGGGKTMLASRFMSILPPPSDEEALEIATIHSASLFGTSPSALATITRPFRAPHHTTTTVALMGGGDPIQPGEVTLAHGGVLFLDELPEFRRGTVESLRTTMSNGYVVIARANARATMPANPMLIAAMNPCPCGYAGDGDQLCICSPASISRYRMRVSGPMLDRFDMHVPVPRVRARELRAMTPGESSAAVVSRVIKTQKRRRSHGHLDLETLTPMAVKKALNMLENAVEHFGMNVRSYLKILKVARTIADMDESQRIQVPHVAEALQYRFLDRRTV